jgi:hypothetical protein
VAINSRRTTRAHRSKPATLTIGKALPPVASHCRPSYFMATVARAVDPGPGVDSIGTDIAMIVMSD